MTWHDMAWLGNTVGKSYIIHHHLLTVSTGGISSSSSIHIVQSFAQCVRMCANHFCGHSLHGKPAAKLHRSCAVSLQSISKFGSEVGWKGEGYHTYLLSYYGFRACGCLGNPLDIQVADIELEVTSPFSLMVLDHLEAKCGVCFEAWYQSFIIFT